MILVLGKERFDFAAISHFVPVRMPLSITL
jgi:hypothetical protein